jgi:hypothetical protein
MVTREVLERLSEEDLLDKYRALQVTVHLYITEIHRRNLTWEALATAGLRVQATIAHRRAHGGDIMKSQSAVDNFLKQVKLNGDQNERSIF